MLSELIILLHKKLGSLDITLKRLRVNCLITNGRGSLRKSALLQFESLKLLHSGDALLTVTYALLTNLLCNVAWPATARTFNEKKVNTTKPLNIEEAIWVVLEGKDK